MTLTKQDIHRKYCEIKGLDSANDNPKYISIFLFNCVLKSITDYDLMSPAEKESLNMILADESTIYCYDKHTQQIKRRNPKTTTKNKEDQS